VHFAKLRADLIRGENGFEKNDKDAKEINEDASQ
jgi:hypothetical protein